MARSAVAAVAAVSVFGAWAALALVVRRSRAASPATGPTGPAGPVRPGRAALPQLPPVRLTPLGRVVLLGAVVLLPVVCLAILNSSSGFVWDDIKNLRQAQVDRLSFDYLMEPTSGHFAPGHRLGDLIQQRAFGFEFPPAQAQLLVGFAVSLVLFQRILAELFGAGLGTYVFTLAFGISMVHVGVTQWWASGLDRVPATILSFLSIWAYLRWHRSRAWPWLAVSLIAVGLGLLFYIKPIFVPVYLVLVTVLLIEPERPLGQSLVAALRDWWVWVLYAAVTGVLGWVYVSRYPLELTEGGGLDVALLYLRILWTRTFVPNLFGIYIPQGAELSGGAVAAAVLAQLLLLAVIVATVVRWPGAWRAWAFFAVTFLVNTLVVGYTRVFATTAEIIAYTVYFNLESVIVFFLALAAAVLGRPRGREVAAWTSPARTAVAAGLAVYLGLSVWGGWRISVPETWIGARSRLILDRVEQELSDLHRAGVDVALVDGVFSADVVPYILVPYNSTSEVVPLFDQRVTFDTDQGELFTIDLDGDVRPVRFEPVAGGLADELVTTDAFGVVGATPEYLDGDRICIQAGDEDVVVGLRSPRRLESEDDPIVLQVEIESRGPVLLSTVVEPVPVNTESLAGGRAKYRIVNIPGGRPVHRALGMDASPVDAAYLVMPARGDLCVYRMELGYLVPR